MRHFLLFLAMALATACPAASAQPEQPLPCMAPAPVGGIRVAAEWEPVVGVLIGWPIKLPNALVIEMAKEVDLYVTVSDCRGEQTAVRTFADWGIDLRRVHCIVTEQGTGYYLTRDWGPFAVFDGPDNHRLVEGRYLDYPLGGMKNERFRWLTRLVRVDYRADDGAPAVVAQALGRRNIQLPIALTGGNAVFDGLGAGFASQILLAENRAKGISEDQFRHTVRQELGVTRFQFLPHFERIGIQHVDCLFKLLDPERILVKRAPPGHPASEAVERAACLLSRLTNSYGRPYQILRIDTPCYHLNKMANYTNSLIVNRKIYVPLFGIPGDRAALATWRAAMPGYQVIGFPYQGWTYTDALHCRVRGIWDPHMLYLAHRRVDACVPWASRFTLDVYVRDYSGAGLIGEELYLAWRGQGSPVWKTIRLQPAAREHTFRVTIEGVRPGQTVEYFLSASSRSGRRETLPRTAPWGFYTFTTDTSLPQSIKETRQSG